MLNTKVIKNAMRQLGLTGQDVAEKCSVSKEAVSNWLSGESIPRPSKLTLLATGLGLEIDDLLDVEEEQTPEPIIAYRMRSNRPVTGAAKEAGDEAALHLRELLPFTGENSLFTPRHLESPQLDSEYIAKAASATRISLGLSAFEPINHTHLISLFHSFGAILIPVFWGGNKEGHENAMSVYLPESKASFVLFNLGCRLDDFSYWLAHEFGHCLTIHSLRGDEGESFAEQFAQQLLFPDALALHVLKEMRVSTDPLAIAHRVSEKYSVSVVTVVKATERLALETNESPMQIATKEFYASWKKSRLTTLTAAQKLFGTPSPRFSEYINKSEQLFRTPIFKAIAKMQRIEGGRNPAFIAAALNMDIGNALSMSYELWDLAD